MNAIKVCGITRSEDVDDALAQGVVYIGVNRWPKSPRFVVESRVPSLLARIPAGHRVFVDVTPDSTKLAAAMEDGFDFFQLHFDPAIPDALKLATIWEKLVGRQRLWFAPIRPPGTLWPEWLFAHADTFLCDGYRPNQYGGTGHKADWARFCALRREHPEKRWVLAGGLGPGNIAAAAACNPDILDLNSGIEDVPGVKNVEKLAKAIHALVSRTTV